MKIFENKEPGFVNDVSVTAWQCQAGNNRNKYHIANGVSNFDDIGTNKIEIIFSSILIQMVLLGLVILYRGTIFNCF